MKKVFQLLLVTLVFACIPIACQDKQKVLTDEELKQKANELAHEYIIVDTHVDIPYRLNKGWEDMSAKTEKGDFDYPRAKEGGLDAPFMSIFTPWQNEDKGTSKALADSLIDMVEKFVVDWPDKFAIATSVADVKSQFEQGKISLPMGMENGSPVEGKLENLKYFYDRGIRYITLTHSKNNHICDSSYEKKDNRKWKGLSPFGRKVVAEMNRVGIMIDVSHISDDAFYQVMELSKAPVIASHSSCRYFTPASEREFNGEIVKVPAWERNMDDEMIKLLAKNGGVIQINFGSSFVNGEYQRMMDIAYDYLDEHDIKSSSPEGKEYLKKYKQENNITYADISDVVANIGHVVELVGIDHLGFGSDFDGLGDSLPTGLKDVSYYPNLIYELLKKGYSNEDIEKICSGNLFRVWSEVERIARGLQSSGA